MRTRVAEPIATPESMMRNAAHRLHPSRSCRFRGALLSLVLAAACRTPTSAPLASVPVVNSLAFENATVDQVAVYVDEQGSRSLLGFVEPGRSVRLRLPSFLTTTHLSQAMLVVVPVGTPRDGGVGGDIAGVIRSEIETTEQLATLRWSLRGHRLIGALPVKPRALPAR